MKKLIIVSASLLMISAVATAQSTENLKSQIKDEKKLEKLVKNERKEGKKELRKLEGKEVSYQTKEQFNRDFKDIKPSKWERGTHFDEAYFIKDGHQFVAYYDYDSQLVGTTTRKLFSDLPAKAQSYINKKYSGYSKGTVVLFDDNEANESDMSLYGKTFEDSDNYFVELKKGSETDIVQVRMDGLVSFFKQM